jgi:hypothetical protein
MIRLLAIRVHIAVLKRAIAISNKLEPRTWVYLAVTQALMAALCFWGYWQSPNRTMRPVEQSTVRYHNIDSDRSGSMVNVWQILLPVTKSNHPVIENTSPGEIASGESFACELSGSAFMRHFSVIVKYNLERDSLCAERMNAGDYSTAKTKPFLTMDSMMFASYSFRQTSQPEVIVMQLSSPENKSQIDAWLKSMMLLQGIFVTIGSALGSVFAWLSYRRGKADLRLKELQVREMEIKIDNMERDRARAVQEAQHSGIILLS